MKLTRRNLRRLILEDLGDQVWSDRASKGSRHHGTEEDTALEWDLWHDFYNYMIEDKPERITQDDINNILAYSDDPRYDDVFINYSVRGIKLYRGIRLFRDDVDELVPGGIKKYLDPRTRHRRADRDFLRDTPVIPVDFMYRPEWFYREGIVSAWTDDYSIAEDFAFTGKNPMAGQKYSPTDTHDLRPGVVSVVFISDTDDGNFLDLSPMYSYTDLGKFHKESEILALGPVQVTGLKLVQVYMDY